MGSEEIRDVRSTEKFIALSLGNAGAGEGSIYLYTSGWMKVEKVSGCVIRSLCKIRECLWKIEIVDRDMKTEQLIVLSSEA